MDCVRVERCAKTSPLAGFLPSHWPDADFENMFHYFFLFALLYEPIKVGFLRVYFQFRYEFKWMNEISVFQLYCLLNSSCQSNSNVVNFGLDWIICIENTFWDLAIFTKTPMTVINTRFIAFTQLPFIQVISWPNKYSENHCKNINQSSITSSSKWVPTIQNKTRLQSLVEKVLVLDFISFCRISYITKFLPINVRFLDKQ